MNEPEKERILQMLSEGILRPDEAAGLLAVLADEPEPAPEPKKKSEEAADKPKPKPKEPLMEVQMQRPDGSSYTVQVPPNLVPLFWQIAKVAIKESARNAAQETWSGLKHIVRNKTNEVKTNVKNRVNSIGSKPESVAMPVEEEDQFEARRRILQMVQNGRINAVDAGRLIQQLDALQEYQKTHPALSPKPS